MRERTWGELGCGARAADGQGQHLTSPSPLSGIWVNSLPCSLLCFCCSLPIQPFCCCRRSLAVVQPHILWKMSLNHEHLPSFLPSFCRWEGARTVQSGSPYGKQVLQIWGVMMLIPLTSTMCCLQHTQEKESGNSSAKLIVILEHYFNKNNKIQT